MNNQLATVDLAIHVNSVVDSDNNEYTVEILAIHLIWQFGDEQQNRQI